MTTVVATDGLVVLNEYESVKVTGLRPSPADIDAAASDALAKRLTLRWLRGDTLEITANSHVGVVGLNCVAIHVRPKLAGRELAVLQMLDYASGLSALRNLDQLQRLGEGLHLRDLVCLLLTRETDKLLRHGLRRDYLRREESLPAVRGRLLTDRQILAATVSCTAWNVATRNLARDPRQPAVRCSPPSCRSECRRCGRPGNRPPACR